MKESFQGPWKEQALLKLELRGLKAIANEHSTLIGTIYFKADK